MSCDDYCCNYGCNQGRDCPARVARVTRRRHDREELPPTVWRRQVRYLAQALLMCLAVVAVSGLTVMVMQ